MVQNGAGNTDSKAFWDRFLPFRPEGDMAPLPDTQKWLMIGPHLQATMLKAMIDQQREMFGFLQKRCDEDMKFAEEMGSATCIGDIMSASLGFCKDMATQYAAHASKAAEIGSQGAIEVAHDLQQERNGILSTREENQAAA
ncbi:MAG: phasin family protein [Sphingobium sp.]